MKSLLAAETQILIKRHLDQLVMCTVYGVCKVHQGVQMTFNTIISKYSELHKSQKSVSQVYFKILVDERTGKEADIITFYNEVFIKTMKSYIISLKPSALERNSILSPMPGAGPHIMQVNKPHVRALCPPSPLRDNLPPENMYFSTIYQTRPIMTPGSNRQPIKSPLIGTTAMTPVTRHLFAFNESATGDLDKANAFMAKKGTVIDFSQPSSIKDSFASAGLLKAP